MSRTDKIVDAVIWLFNLLTFLVAALAFFVLCLMFYKAPESIKGLGDLVFVILLLAVNGGIVGITGKWIFSKTATIYVPGLLSFWVFLIIIYIFLIGFTMGSMGMGSSQ